MTSAPTIAKSTSVTPPRTRDRLLAWLILLGFLVAGALAMLTDLGRPPVTSVREATALATALETWQRQQQFEDEAWSYQRITPFHEGRAQLDEPPGRTWLHLAAIATMDYESPQEEAIYRARLVSVFFILLTIASAYWAGMSIGGVVTASMAGLLCLGMPVLLDHGRIATFDAIELGLSMFAIAAALWSTRPLRPAATLIRQAIGWAVCGLALGAATLTAGPTTLPTVIAPILVMLLLVPHRIGHVLGLIAAILIAGLIVTPWAGYAHLQQADAWRSWMLPLVMPENPTAGYFFEVAAKRLLWIVLGVAPWILWLLAAMIQPFSTSSEGSRNRLFIGWAWFVTVAILLAFAPGEPVMRTVLPALTAAAVLMGQLFRHGADLSDEGRHARFWRWLRWPQWSIMLILSLALPAGGLFQDTLVEKGWLNRPLVMPMNQFYWAAIATVLVALVAVSTRFVVKHFPVRALACWALWSVTLFALLIFPMARGYADETERLVTGKRITTIVGDAPLIYLTDLPRPDPITMLYSGKVFASLNRAQLEILVAEGIGLYLLTPQDHTADVPWVRVEDFPLESLTLWHRPANPELNLD